MKQLNLFKESDLA